jgi:hypothetical protein
MSNKHDDYCSDYYSLNGLDAQERFDRGSSDATRHGCKIHPDDPDYVRGWDSTCRLVADSRDKLIANYHRCPDLGSPTRSGI